MKKEWVGRLRELWVQPALASNSVVIFDIFAQFQNEESARTWPCAWGWLREWAEQHSCLLKLPCLIHLILLERQPSLELVLFLLFFRCQKLASRWALD